MNQPARSRLRSVPTAEPSAEELVRAAAKGDKRAFTAIYRANARYVAGVVYRMLGTASEVDDVVQETFIAAIKGLDKLDEPAALRRWLVTIAVRKVHRRLAQRGKKRRLDEELSLAMKSSTDHAAARDIEDLYDALSRISPALRIPWILARLEGHSLIDVAAECSVSLATAKRRIAKAEARLRSRLDHG